MSVVPQKDKRKDKLKEKDEQIDELSKALEKANSRYSQEPDLKKRSTLRTFGIAATALTVLGAVSGMTYLSSLNKSPKNSETQSNPDPNNPDTWPVRNSLRELIDAQQEIGSLSQYFLSVYSTGDEVTAAMNDPNSKEWAYLNQQQATYLVSTQYPNIFEQQYKNQTITDKVKCLLSFPGDYYGTQNRIAMQTFFYGPNSAIPTVLGLAPSPDSNGYSIIPRVFENQDSTDKIYFRSKDKSVNIIAIG